MFFFKVTLTVLYFQFNCSFMLQFYHGLLNVDTFPFSFFALFIRSLVGVHCFLLYELSNSMRSKIYSSLISYKFYFMSWRNFALKMGSALFFFHTNVLVLVQNTKIWGQDVTVTNQQWHTNLSIGTRHFWLIVTSLRVKIFLVN